MSLCHFRGLDLEPYDSGICIIDLTARIIAYDASYSCVGRDGEITYWDSETGEQKLISYYYLPDDWLFVHDVDQWRWQAPERQARFEANRIDSREILYHKVAEFIANECFEARRGLAGSKWSPNANWEWRELPERAQGESVLASADAIAEIHARWLMTTREDLNNRAPRDLLLDKRKFIDLDIHYRQIQYSEFRKCPAPLHPEIAGYLYAGYGTNENVLYYEFLRHLITKCWNRVVEPENSNADYLTHEDEIARLNEEKDAWLNSVEPGGYWGCSPSRIIECERRRMPITRSPAEILGEDDPLTQAVKEGTYGPMFVGLDAAHLDEEFPFSDFKTREDLEANERKWREFNREFSEEMNRKKAAKERDVEEDESFESEGDRDAPF